MNRVAFAILGTPALLRAAWRACAGSGAPLDERVEKLRRVRPFRSSLLMDPQAWGAVAGRIGTRLPVAQGPCLRRALLLLDLHARCGLEPRLLLSYRGGGESDPDPVAGHAWLDTDPAGRAEGWEAVAEI
jgi:hypothetical protein